MNSYVLGVEYFVNSIRIALFAKRGASYQFLSYKIFSRNASSPTEITSEVQAFLDSHTQSKRDLQAVVSIPELFTFLRYIQVPKGTKKQTAEAVKWEIASSSTEFPANPVIGWEVIESTKTKTHIDIVALKTEMAEEISTLLEKLGVSLQAIEPRSISLSRSGGFGNKPILLVSVVDQELHNVIVWGGVPVFSSHTSITTDSKGKLGAQAKDVLIESIKRSLDFWKKSGQEPLTKIVLEADEFIDASLTGDLEKQTGIPTSQSTLRKNARIKLHTKNAKTHASQTSVGAVERFLHEDMLDTINLLPQTQISTMRRGLQAEKMKGYLNTVIRVHLILLGILLAGVILTKTATFALTREIGRQELQRQNHPAQELTKNVTKVNTMAANFITLLSQSTPAATRLADIAALTPESITFDAVRTSTAPDETWEISGTGDRVSILAFYHALKDKSGAAGVKLAYSSLSPSDEAQFKVTVTWLR